MHAFSPLSLNLKTAPEADVTLFRLKNIVCHFVQIFPDESKYGKWQASYFTAVQQLFA